MAYAKLNKAQVERCLALLREADEVLMAADELAIAVHLALVIDLLKARQRHGI